MAQAATKGGGRKRTAPRKSRTSRTRPEKRGLIIDGKFHEYPDNYTLDETMGVCEIWGVDDMLLIPEDGETLRNPTHVKVLVWVMLRRDALKRGEDFTVEEAGNVTWERLDVSRAFGIPPNGVVAAGGGEGDDADPPAVAAAAGTSRRRNSRTSSASTTEES